MKATYRVSKEAHEGGIFTPMIQENRLNIKAVKVKAHADGWVEYKFSFSKPLGTNVSCLSQPKDLFKFEEANKEVIKKVQVVTQRQFSPDLFLAAKSIEAIPGSTSLPSSPTPRATRKSRKRRSKSTDIRRKSPRRPLSFAGKKK
jgi:hypothetical protein